MIKALLLIFEPVQTWERIYLAQRTCIFILGLYLLPLLVLTSVCEGYGLVHYAHPGVFVSRPAFTPAKAGIYEGAQLLLTLAVVFISAKVIKSMGDTFHGRHTFRQSFTAVAYGLGPMLCLRLLDTFPTIFSPWVGWSIGICLTFAVLYQGVPRMMEPDPPHAFGLFLTSALLLVLSTGLLRFVTASYLEGKFTKLDTLINGWGAAGSPSL
jgi:hypothetical protein